MFFDYLQKQRICNHKGVHTNVNQILNKLFGGFLPLHAHVNAIAHSSNYQKGQKNLDWCLYKCQHKQLVHPVEYIRSPWIRPEDVSAYEKIGIEHFKITERGFPTEILLKRVKAYTERSFEGNLLDLVQGHGYLLAKNQEKKLDVKNHFDSIEEIVAEINRVRGLGQERTFARHSYIDNKKLDHFIDFFVDNKCTKNCESCGYCKHWADVSITYDDDVHNYLVYLYAEFEKKLF